jgi:hypothetical protein
MGQMGALMYSAHFSSDNTTIFFIFFFETNLYSGFIGRWPGPVAAEGTSYSNRSFKRAGVPRQLEVHDHRRLTVRDRNGARRCRQAIQVDAIS